MVDGSFPGADPHDRHVHAAAVACRADILLTSDKGFSAEEPDALPYDVYRPDEFFLLVEDIAPALVRDVTREQTLYWFREVGRADLAGALVKAGCPEFAVRVHVHQAQLSFPHDTPRP